MLSIVAAAWRQVLNRARADWLILSAAVLTILLATTLLAAGPIYAGAVTVSGLRRTLHDAPIQKADIQIYVDTSPGEYRGRDQVVTRVATGTFAAVGSRIERSARSTSFALPGQAPDAVRDLAVFAYYAGFEQHAHLVSGSWPQGGGDPVEAVIPQATADKLNLAPGSTLELTNRLQANLIVRVRITGTYEINSVNDPYWWGETLDLAGVDVGQSFTTYGPFVVSSDAFFGPLSSAGARFNWRVFPAFDRIEVAMLSGMIGNVDNLNGWLNRGLGANDQFLVETSLSQILRDAQRSLLVTRTGVLVVTVQLAILAGYALLLTANLLIDRRRVETSLLHSRGASTGQIVMLALMEALLLAIPAALAGPWIAALSLRILNHIGPLAAIGLPLHPEVNRDAYLLSFVAAFGCVLALVFPSLQSARSFVQARQSRARQATRGLAQRAGIDLVLVAAAGLAYWQLRRYGAPITETVQGKLGIDPLLVAAPAIGLLAGAVVALRIIPLLAGIVDRGAPRTRRLVPALGAWQVARRPLGYARSALLLMLAIAIGLFALAYSSTWALSQQDQANYQVGADVRVRPDIRTGSSIPGLDLPQAQGQIGGVAATMPVMRDYLQASRSSGNGTLLALDAATAPRVVSFRPDLATVPFDDLMRALASARPALPAIKLPGTPQRLALDITMTLDPLPAGAQLPANRTPDLSPYVSVVIQDGRGLLHELGPLRLADDGASHRLVVPLAYRLPDGRVALPEYPLSVVALDLDLYPLPRVVRSGQLDLGALQLSGALDGEDWSAVPLAASGVTWGLTQYGLSPVASVTPVGAQGNGGIAVRFSAGATRGNGFALATFQMTAAGPAVPNSLPAIVSQSFLDQTATRVGDTISMDLEGQRRDVRITGAFTGFPTLDPAAPTVVVDLPTLEMVKFQSDGNMLGTGEWWIATTPGRRGAVANALELPPYSSPEVASRVERGQSLLADPVALGIIGVLSLGFVAAGLFAALGFAVSAAVSAWDRLTEFALLRALGLSPRQLSSWLSLENGLLVGVSLAGGTALGLLLAWLILPLVSLTQQASRTVPEVIVVVPWRSVVVLEAVSLAALALAIGAMAAMLRRIGLGSILRLGGE